MIAIIGSADLPTVVLLQGVGDTVITISVDLSFCTNVRQNLTGKWAVLIPENERTVLKLRE